MKNYYLSILIFVIILSFGNTVLAQTQNIITPSLNTTIVPKCADGTPEADCYVLLEALPGSDGTPLESINLTTTGGEGGLGGFINFAMEIGIGVAGVLGVVMLVIYGFQYAAEDKNVGNFTILKDKITKVVLGLMLLLGITIILRTINPDLLIVEPDIEKIKLTTDQLSGDDGPKAGTASTINIPGAIQNSNGRTDVRSIKNSLNQWDALLSKYARQYGIDCTLLKAIMVQESKGQQNANSGEAAGLMQVKYSNFGSIPRMKWYDPETNISVGAQILKTYLGNPCLSSPNNGWYTFPGCTSSNINYPIAAYNGGYKANSIPTSCGNSMTKWQCGAGAYAETKNYVTKVLGYYNDLRAASMTCN